jgi:hypothetical protein
MSFCERCKCFPFGIDDHREGHMNADHTVGELEKRTAMEKEPLRAAVRVSAGAPTAVEMS